MTKDLYLACDECPCDHYVDRILLYLALPIVLALVIVFGVGLFHWVVTTILPQL